MSIVRHRNFGKPSRPTIYYLTGYTGRIKQYATHIRTLVLAGFRVVAFEYDDAILDAGNPNKLVEALKDIAVIIDKDKQEHRVAGVYGVSLGSWLGGNILVLCDIEAGVFNTGAASVLRAIWETPRFEEQKMRFVQNGYDKAALQKVWGPYEFAPEGRRWNGKRVLIMSSPGDEILGIEEVRRNIRAWQNGGDDIQFVESRRSLSHTQAIIRNMLRVRQTPSFFRLKKLTRQMGSDERL